MGKEALNFVKDLIQEDANPNTIILFLVFTLFIWALSRASIIYDFVDKFNKRESSKLKELLTDENVSEKAKITLRDKLDLIAYQKITKIEINDVFLQEQIICYCKLAKGKLKYSDFKKAVSLFKINDDYILTIRKPDWYERLFHVVWVILSVCVFILFSWFIFVLVYFPSDIQLKIVLLILTIGLGAMFFAFMNLASFLPAAGKIKNEIEKNPFIIQRNKAITKAIQTDAKAVFHPLAHLSEEEQQNRIKKVLGARQNEPELKEIFTEIDRVRHSEYGRQIDSLDD